MAAYYGAADKYNEICEWYDGYRFGRNEIFNPWSVINYFNNACEPRAFWQSTGSNDIIGEILQKLDTIIPPSTAISIQEAVYSGDGVKMQKLIQTLLTQSVSCYDTAGENFYHGFMLGLCALFGGSYTTSNRESGNGRYDIQLMPENNGLPGILIELKAEKNCTGDSLKKLSEKALKQITDKKYDAEMSAKGIKTIYKYGVAFSGKKVEIATGLLE